MIHCLLAINKDIHVIVPIRNMDKAKIIFSETELQNITFIECNIVEYDYWKLKNVDYIIHCAAPTSSRFFIEYPVDTLNFILDGTKVLLDYAKDHLVKGFVYLSSLEVYGSLFDDNNFETEEIQGYIDPMSVRSSYPMAKRAAENLCCLYAKQYNVPVKVARLTQTTGAGLSKDDNRVIAHFARLTAKGHVIVLHTTGESARPYCYTTDAVNAILYILLKGNTGEASNVANEETYISAKEMAEYLRDNFNSSINVRVELKDNMGYAPTSRLPLSAAKLRSLGWEPTVGLLEIFKKLVAYLS